MSLSGIPDLELSKAFEDGFHTLIFQMVWEKTTKLGCASVYCSKVSSTSVSGKAILTVCRYGPA